MRHRENGQATTETILLTWIMLVFFGAAYQLFLVNESVYRSLTAVHQELFQAGYATNCADDDDPDCRFNTDKNAKVIWNVNTIPEIEIRVVRLFRRFGLTDTVVLQSNARGPEPAKGCDIPCKKTKMGAGTYYPILSCIPPFGSVSECLRSVDD